MPLVNSPEDCIGEAFEQLFGVNVKGYLPVSKAAYRELAKTRGCIVCTASNTGFYPCAVLSIPHRSMRSSV
jgi:NADP-dependent 3-hydroxy acid dehydrogenase YdfG